MGWDWGGVGSGAMSGASSGSMLGPWGAAAGGVAGGLLGGLKGGADRNAPKVENFYGAIPNTSNDLGGQTWSQGPDGQWSSHMGFGGQAANTFGALQGGMGKAAAYDPTQARDQAVNQNLDYGMSRLAPMWNQQNQGFTSGAANMGLDPGTEGYNAQRGNIDRQQSDQFGSMFTNALNAGNETQRTQMQQMNQPFLQAGEMMNMLGKQGNNLNAPMAAAGLTQKANDNAADRATAASNSKKGGAGGLLGGSGGKKGGGAKTPSDQNAGYDPNLGGYNF